MRCCLVVLAVSCLAVAATANSANEFQARSPFPVQYLLLPNHPVFPGRAATDKNQDPATANDAAATATADATAGVSSKRPRILTTHVADLVTQMVTANGYLVQLGQKTDAILTEISAATTAIGDTNTIVNQGFGDVLNQNFEATANITYSIETATDAITTAIAAAADKISQNDVSFKLDEVIGQLKKLIEIIGP